MTSCYDVTKKVRGSLGRVTETVATTAGSNAVLLPLGNLETMVGSEALRQRP